VISLGHFTSRGTRIRLADRYRLFVVFGCTEALLVVIGGQDQLDSLEKTGRKVDALRPLNTCREYFGSD
jgi:hypothetical protein